LCLLSPFNPNRPDLEYIWNMIISGDDLAATFTEFLMDETFYIASPEICSTTVTVAEFAKHW